MLGRILALLQFLLPRYALTSLIYRIARLRSPSIKNFLIARFIRLYNVNVAEVKLDIPQGFATFNDFFIRELEDGARPIDTDTRVLVSPVDGTISQAGQLRQDRILQAKGREFTLAELLATDLEDADPFVDGAFATIYLAPHNYHRVHAPLAGELVAVRYVPGDLFSVNAATAAVIPGLFRRNERLIMHLRTVYGPCVLIMVGALNVGSISTPWSGEIRPRKKGVVEAINIGAAATTVSKGGLLGWFNMGSTVILLLPKNSFQWHDGLRTDDAVVIGRPIAGLKDGSS